MAASASTSYISTGANRSSSCAVATSTGILAYGSGPSISLWDTTADSHTGVYAVLHGHVGLVTTLKAVWDNKEQGTVTLVSGDSAGNVRLWNGLGKDFTSTHDFVAHRGSSVSAIGVVPSQEGADDAAVADILTGGSDGVVKRWRVSSVDRVEHVETLDLGGRLALDLELSLLPGSKVPVLVVGCTDRKVQVWTLLNGSFTHAISLEGHEDWVRCLALTPYPSSTGDKNHSDLLLATGAQDNYVRLWRISRVVGAVTKDGDADLDLDLLDEFERRVAGDDGGTGSVQISTKAHVLSDGTDRYDVTLEALLIGHESGLTNVRWSTVSPACTSPVLLSTAADNSLVIWSPTDASHSRDGIWIPEHRFGAFGGRGLAFFGAVWVDSPSGAAQVIATGWTGGVERWIREVHGDSDGHDAAWVPGRGLTGHFGAVKSVAWDPEGDYLLSTGTDQTSRIHAACSPVTPDNVSNVPAAGSPNAESAANPSPSPAVWAEIARPQIHGYDMCDGVFLSSLRMASAADEKVLRVFDATEGFDASLRGLGVRSDETGDGDGERARATRALPRGATVPPLGLSNRALGKASDDVDMGLSKLHVTGEARDSVSAAMTSLPTEEELATSTLWPEVEKVYGHGYELVTIATSHKGDIVATASRASSADHAAVRLVSASTWNLIGEPLGGHTLTVTRIAFSPDDERVLTVSRDRGWRLYARGGNAGFIPLAKEERAHARMVLDASWAPSGTAFITASRDKTVKMWSLSKTETETETGTGTGTGTDGGAWINTTTIKLSDAATAVDARSDDGAAGRAGALIVAVGTETGSIEVYRLDSDVGASVTATRLLVIPAHTGSVNRLAWRPRVGAALAGGGGGTMYQLASGGDDRSVRVFDVCVPS